METRTLSVRSGNWFGDKQSLGLELLNADKWDVPNTYWDTIHCNKMSTGQNAQECLAHANPTLYSDYSVINADRLPFWVDSVGLR